jgi:hypothetical protein
MSETEEAQQPTVTIVADDAIQNFVGKNYEYYQRKWVFARTPAALKGFNVAAFFLGVVWMVYRKMYMYAAIVFGLLLLDAVVESFLPLPEAIGKGLTWGIYAAFGLLGNYMYKIHVDEKISQITAAFPIEQVDAELAKQGGVNLAGAWVFGVVLIAIVSIAIWVIMSEV